jgi:hypothetical protein
MTDGDPCPLCDGHMRGIIIVDTDTGARIAVEECDWCGNRDGRPIFPKKREYNIAPNQARL